MVLDLNSAKKVILTILAGVICMGLIMQCNEKAADWDRLSAAVHESNVRLAEIENKLEKFWSNLEQNQKKLTLDNRRYCEREVVSYLQHRLKDAAENFG